MIEMFMQSVGVTTDDVADVKKLIETLNKLPLQIARIEERLDAIDEKLKLLTEAQAQSLKGV